MSENIPSVAKLLAARVRRDESQTRKPRSAEHAKRKQYTSLTTSDVSKIEIRLKNFATVSEFDISASTVSCILGGIHTKSSSIYKEYLRTYTQGKHMKVMQIGSGSGFNFDAISSSFLIQADTYYILVDCGFNVLNKLQTIGKEDTVDYIKNISTVCITHLHEDHISNLMSLIYYRYFMYGLQTCIVIGKLSI